MGQKTPVIAYVLQLFPNRTETFVYREILALRDAGFEVVTIANRVPNRDQLPDELRDFVSSTHYIVPFHIHTLLIANLLILLTRFRGYMRSIRLLFDEPGLNPKIWLRNVMHFQGSVYMAYRIRHLGVDHLHAHFSNNATSLAIFMSILLDIPFSFTVHNNIFVDRLLLPAKMKDAKFMVCISQYSRDALLRKCNDNETIASKTQIVHCGVDPTGFPIKQDYAIVGKIPTILSASQLVERKGMLYLIEACAILKSRGFSFRCMIAGDGEEREFLDSHVKELDLSSEVQFSGVYSQSELRRLFEKADLFVLPCIVASNGDRDGIPVVLMEAMGAGLPVISTRVSGIPELINHEHNGILVSEKDASALAESILRLLEDQKLRQHLGQHAHETIVQDFNLPKTIQTLIMLYEEHLHDGANTPG